MFFIIFLVSVCFSIEIISIFLHVIQICINEGFELMVDWKFI
jgi:hypothetical protein